LESKLYRQEDGCKIDVNVEEREDKSVQTKSVAVVWS